MSTDIQNEIVKLLTAKGETVAAAESCTGGGILASLTSVPGSSAVVWGGIVTYANEAKVSMLDVDNRLIEKDGAVSSGVAKSMAWGMRIRSGADWTIAVTGVAGPGGGTQDKPVGTVWIAWCDPRGAVSARLYHIDGNREEVRRKSVEEALTGLRQLIFEHL